MMAKILRSWTLFGVLALAISIANALNIARSNFGAFAGTQAAVVRTVWFALPLFLAAFLASSLVRLWPGGFTRWLLGNRRFWGLAFAVAMAWHLSLVAYFFWRFGNPLGTRDLMLDVIGLIFLLAMTLTSFAPFRACISSANWRRLHTVGVYVLWALPTFFFLEDYLRFHGLTRAAATASLLIAFGVRVTSRFAASSK